MSDSQPYRFVGTYAVFNDGETIEFKKFGQVAKLDDEQAHFCLDRRIPILPEDLFDNLGIAEGVTPSESEKAAAVQAALRYRSQKLTPQAPLPSALKEIHDAN
jgi:hypothetical protein